MTMDRGNLLQATALYNEANAITHALAVIDRNATITAVTLTATIPPGPATPPPPGEGGDEPPPPPEPMLTQDTVTVSTEGLAYPPQMLAAIKAQLQARYTEISAELTALGVAPVAAMAAAPQARQPQARPKGR